MRLATWNVNSVRARVTRIVEFAVRETDVSNQRGELVASYDILTLVAKKG